MNIRLPLLLAAALLAVWLTPGAIAADLTDVGFIDQADVANLPAFVSANRQLAAYKSQLDAQFSAQGRRMRTDADRQRVAMQLQQELNDKQRDVVGPLFQRAQLAIAAISASRGLSIVVDKRIVIYGGQDITKDVEALFLSPQAIQPPTASPPPRIDRLRRSERARRPAEGADRQHDDAAVRDRPASGVFGEDGAG